ncbi:MAG: AMP-binding protein [Bacteroidia bacterium]
MPLDSLILNGHTYSKNELVHLANDKLQLKKLSDYERFMFLFIKEWVSAGKTIQVKTSGSTGVPKIMEVQKKQMIESAKMTCSYFDITKKSNILLCLSTEFIAGKMMIVRAFLSGANLVTVKPGNNPLENLKQKIDFAAMVPLQVENILADSKTARLFNFIDNVIIGGATISKGLEAKLAKCKNSVYSTFAMTETLSHFALRRLSGNERSDYFELLPGINISTDERGCMVVYAPLLNDAPIVTNDIVECTDSRHFRWLGRYDNVINSGGIKLYPETLEEKLSAIIKLHRFFIASLPDRKLGQKVVLVLEGAGKSDISRIKKGVEKVLGKYEKPREYIAVKEFAETPNGKVKRKETLLAVASV